MKNNQTTLYPLAERKNKVDLEHFSRPIPQSLIEAPRFSTIFPSILGGEDLRSFLANVQESKSNKRPIVFMMGAHMLKVGLGPLVIQLMEAGFIHHIATNGAGSIHDYEIALIGATSEDVATNLEDGRFGNWQETSQINNIITSAAKDGLGYGEAIGKAIIEQQLPYQNYSVFAAAYKNHIPITVHTAIGTEITHQHPNANGAALGETSLRDFHTLIETVKNIENGIVMNWGSAVIMPEVFLKALTVARNQGGRCKHFTAANFDMIRHYRPTVNVVERPTKAGGKGFTFIGQHEIMLPLLTLLLLQEQNEYSGNNQSVQ